MSDAYLEFLRSKMATAPATGFEVDPAQLHPSLFPHQRDTVAWALAGGRRAIFKSFGLGKTRDQLEIARQMILRHDAGQVLIVLPLGVRMEFAREAEAMEMGLSYVRNDAEAGAAGRVVMTNYERVRDGHISPEYLSRLLCVLLDEASVLRSYGSKTYQGFLDLFSDVRYRYVATATPSPNRFKELIHYAGFLGVMDTGQALTRFFQRDSEKAGNLTLMPHMEAEFWLWLSSWALFVTKPSDLGYSDEGYDLPELHIHWHQVDVDHTEAGFDSWGQGQLLRDAKGGVREEAREKRDTLTTRLAKALELISAEPGEHWLLWHHLEDERRAIERAWRESGEDHRAATVYGSQDLDEREALIRAFADGDLPILATKPEIAGSGTNLQRHCARAVFLGIDYSFNDLIQSIHRIYRFQQTREVHVHLIYAESEIGIRRAIERKWRQHDEMTGKMIEIVRRYGLSDAAHRSDLARTIGIQRQERRGERYTAVLNDCVLETGAMEANSVDLIVTSIPFGNQYEYTPSYNDFGFSEDNSQFWRQMDFLTPELLRVLRPGRIAAIHVKDRIRFGKVTGDGFPTLDPFSDECSAHFRRHGFRLMARITVTTDVVRENNQTYRLGYSEMCKDSSKMGVGTPEYVLVFRKLPSDTSNGYADDPISRTKYGYPLRQWQIDAHQYWRSSGDRLLSPEELLNMATGSKKGMENVRDWWVQFNRTHVYDYETHVDLGRAMEEGGKLPKEFMLFMPESWSEEVWTDVTRMRTLNSEQSLNRQQNHVCPFPLDIPRRCIIRWALPLGPDALVYDPFGGLGSTAVEAIKLGLRAKTCELNDDYWRQGAVYCHAAEVKATAPTLFAALEAEEVAA